MTVQVWIQHVLNTGWNVLRYDQSTCPPEELPGCQLDLLPRFTQTFTSFFRAGKLLPVPGETAEQPLLPGPAASTARHGTTRDPSGQPQDLQEGGTARMTARQGCLCQGTGHQAWPGGCCWGNLGAFGYLGCRCEPCHGRGAGALVGLSAEQAQHSMGLQSSPYFQPHSQIQPKTPQLNLQAGDTTQNRAVMARGEGK